MTTIRLIEQPIRGCGRRKAFGLYLVSNQHSGDGALPDYSVVESPIPVQRKPHRTPVRVDGDNILRRLPEDEWLIGTSARTSEKKRGIQWEVEMFGMPTAKRMRTGVCLGQSDAEACIRTLESHLVWDQRATDVIRSMSMAGVAEIGEVSSDFAELIRAAQMFMLEGRQVSHLLTVAARAWSMAAKVKSRNTGIVIPLVADLLTLIGLGLDAVAVRVEHMDVD